MRPNKLATLAATTGLALMISGCATGSNSAARAAVQERGQVELAELTEGRVAGEPVRCVSPHTNQQFTIIDGTALYLKRGNTIYVNVPSYPDSLDDDDVLLIEYRGTSQLCRNQPIKMLDRGSGFLRGVISLNDFVPYKKMD
ncbi:hypothetical protein [Altererythrobacter sp. ZODW24]|uniref:hypothetical protein n=1 Tax=Altererythrobacter sp. ZODW24 TaxID=2185142 RepID=UPI000DF8206A|nr:hypothetical protein [Altererythrobacter sp. ZODW24]